MTVVSLDCLCWQVRRFGLRIEAKSKARISFGPDWLALCLGKCLRDEFAKADAGFDSRRLHHFFSAERLPRARSLILRFELLLARIRILLVSAVFAEAISRGLAMSGSLSEIAKRIEGQPWNRSGTDKTWVLNAMSAQRRFQQEVRQAKRVPAR
jgi:hypothetical protein